MIELQNKLKKEEDDKSVIKIKLQRDIEKIQL